MIPYDALVLVGPTASGKSTLAMELAERLGGTIINADSVQLYKNLRVLTARPSKAHMERVPHALYGLLDEHENCSVVQWRAMALEAIAQALKEKRLPILCGGTGFYLQALLKGLSPIPPVPQEVHLALLNTPSLELYEDLKTCDPASARLLHPHDQYRILRALEVFYGTKKPLSFWKTQPKVKAPYRFFVLLLLPERDHVYQACATRAHSMLCQEAFEEVASLRGDTTPLHKAIGVREIKAYLRGDLSFTHMYEQILYRTRHYAKRQTTWVRHQITPDLIVPSPLLTLSTESFLSQALRPSYRAPVMEYGCASPSTHPPTTTIKR